MFSMTEQNPASGTKRKVAHLLSGGKGHRPYASPMTLGPEIKRHRSARNMTQRALAKLIGVSHGALGQWELDETTPTYDHLQALQAILGTQFSQAIAPTAPDLREIIKDPDELALLRFWRSLDREERIVVAKVLDLNRSRIQGKRSLG
jgi:transcriptional regulator with XRE-family HTH domain